MDAMDVTAKSLLDVAEVMLIALDSAGNIGLVNRKACEILGHTQEDLIGRNWFALCLPPEDRDAVASVFQKIMSGQIESFEYHENAVQRKDGSLRVIAWHNSLLRDEAGGITACLCSGKDITERRTAEKALRNSEAQYRTLAESFVDIPYRLDMTGLVTYVGPQVERYGFDPGEIISHHMDEFLHPEDEDRAARVLLEVVTAGSRFCERYRINDKNGRVIWMEASGQGVRDETGRILGVTGIMRDVTERVQVEEVLRESEERFRKIFEDGPIGMTIAGPEMRFLMANNAFCRMLDRSEADITWLTFKEITHPDDVGHDVEGIQRLLDGVIPAYSAEKRYLRPSGQIVWGMLTLSISRDNDGRFLYFLAMIEDITARKAAEVALKESEERYRHLVDSSNDWVWEVDASGVYTYASPRVRDVLGYEPEEIVGREPFDLMSPEEATRVGQVFQSIVTEQREFRGLENTNIHKDGHLVVLETNGIPRFDDKGHFCGYRGMDRDVTERRQTEDTLRSA